LALLPALISHFRQSKNHQFNPLYPVLKQVLETYVSLKRRGGDLKFLRPCGRVAEVLRILRLLEIIPSFEDETQAVISFGPQTFVAKS
jgi:hypothetical protein